MLCQKCCLREANLRIWVAKSSKGSGMATERPNDTMAVCQECAHSCEQDLASEAVGLAPGLKLTWERLRVLHVAPKWTKVRLLRSESAAGLPTDWAILTTRLSMPSLQVGDEFELGFGPDTLDWLTGVDVVGP